MGIQSVGLQVRIKSETGSTHVVMELHLDVPIDSETNLSKGPDDHILAQNLY